ncbi:MAG: DUF302 domain-containing protein [Gammaproteobacteria bacterium]|nr:DUF302 domain-containing protein [Gammaproteobacteria bacterium]
MYHFSTTLQDDFNTVIDKVTEALKTEGFGVLTDIDVKATFKAKLDVDHRPYRILGACNPAFAHKAISAEPDIGLLLPCNVVVRQEENNDITVAFMDPAAVLQLVDKEGISEIASEVRSRLERVCAAISN